LDLLTGHVAGQQQDEYDHEGSSTKEHVKAYHRLTLAINAAYGSSKREAG